MQLEEIWGTARAEQWHGHLALVPFPKPEPKGGRERRQEFRYWGENMQITPTYTSDRTEAVGSGCCTKDLYQWEEFTNVTVSESASRTSQLILHIYREEQTTLTVSHQEAYQSLKVAASWWWDSNRDEYLSILRNLQGLQRKTTKKYIIYKLELLISVMKVTMCKSSATQHLTPSSLGAR